MLKLCRRYNRYNLRGDYTVAAEETQHIYLVISQTGTVLSRILKRITGAEYNHVSLGLKEDLSSMYSFGRKNPYNPFWGGFVTESPHSGTFKRFYNTKVIVLALEIDNVRYASICKMIEQMLLDPKKYHYNYLGLFLAAFKIVHKAPNCYYCSEFVKYVLQKHGIDGSESLAPIIQPMHFLNIPNTSRIYSGKLSEYSVLPAVKITTT